MSSESSPRISIAMATYNGEKFLDQQLRSLLSQTLPPVEIVISDDCSTDGSIELLARFQKISPIPIFIKSNEQRMGWRENFFQALGMCNSNCDIIALCDQDDIWDSEKLAICAKEFSDDDAMLVFHDAELINSTEEPIGSLGDYQAIKRAGTVEDLGPLHDVLGFTMLFRSDLLKMQPCWADSHDKDEPGTKAAHDQWFYFLASALGKVAYLDRKLVQYRQHGANAVGLWHIGHKSWPTAIKNAARRQLAALRRLGRMHSLILQRIITLQAANAALPSRGAAIKRAIAYYQNIERILSAKQAIYTATGITAVLRAFIKARDLEKMLADRRWAAKIPTANSDLFLKMTGIYKFLGEKQTLVKNEY